MTVNHSAISTRFLWHSAAAGLLVDLTIIYFWPELASWWPGDLPRIYSTLYELIGLRQTDVESLPLAVYGRLLIAGFVLTFLHPGHGKMPIVAWMLHNQPSRRHFFSWIACLIHHWVGEAGCEKWRAHFALFSGAAILCMATNTLVRIVFSLLNSKHPGSARRGVRRMHQYARHPE